MTTPPLLPSALSSQPLPMWPMLSWDLYCRVVDNLGDAGVCWRLAATLAARGQRVRLVIDDPQPLSFMAPGGADGVVVQRWPGTGLCADVVIGAFGCVLPPAVIAAMARQVTPPVWINLEHLSAESYVERSHGLPSPQACGLTTWFYYPGFTERTGGLLREPGLLAQRAAFDRSAWLATQGLRLQGEERVVALFSYANALLPRLLSDLARKPTLLLLTPGPAQQQVAEAPCGVRLHRLPWLDQGGFDHLLWAAELNVVRGEDSLVRALWAGAPFVWQAYPQTDGAHIAKVEALIARLRLPDSVAAVWRAWNRFEDGTDWPGLPGAAGWADWQQAATRATAGQGAVPDLCTQLCAFVGTRRAATDVLPAKGPG